MKEPSTPLALLETATCVARVGFNPRIFQAWVHKRVVCDDERREEEPSDTVEAQSFSHVASRVVVTQ